MIRIKSLSVLSVFCLASVGFAAKHKVEPLKEAPPTKGISAAIAKTLQKTGYRVIRGSKRKICDIWLCKQSQVKKFEGKNDILYPWQNGHLMGVVRYNNRGGDFRGQRIGKGIYTLRYQHQPVDGAHVGTSPTRDFFLLTSTKVDKSVMALDYKKLVKGSQDAAKSAHPAMLSLQRVKGKGKIPSIRNQSDHDWWIVRIQGKASMGKKSKMIVMDLVVAGQAAE